MEQPNYPVYNGPISYNLARRLAESAAGLRDGKFYFFVARLEHPFELKCRKEGADNEQEASEKADLIFEEIPEDKRDQFKKFGPFRSTVEQGFDEENGYASVNGFDEIRFYKNEEMVHKENINNESPIDVLVFNMAAFDKFYLPYYTNLYGLEAAITMRQEAIKMFTRQSPLKGAMPISIAKHKHCTSSSISPFGSEG